MGKRIFQEYDRHPCVLCFDKNYTLVSVFRSSSDAADLLSCDPGAITNNMLGYSKSSNGFYWRAEDITISISIEDIGILTVHEFDKLCGVESDTFPDAKIYSARKNKRKIRADVGCIKSDAIRVHEKNKRLEAVKKSKERIKRLEGKKGIRKDF